MMLTLVAVSLNDQPLSQQITAVFSASGGTIGRADHNTLTLPDPQRHISRLQAEVMQHGPDFVIRNVGAANPITVGTQTLNHGETAKLSNLDAVRVGGYLLKVQIDPTTVPGPRTSPNRAITRVPTAPPVPRPAPAAVAVQAVAPAPVPAPPPVPVPAAAPAFSPSDPFADLLGPMSGSPPSAPTAAASSAGLGGGLSQSNPFADLFPGGMAASPAAPQAPAAAESGLLPTGIFEALTPAPPAPTPPPPPPPRPSPPTSWAPAPTRVTPPAVIADPFADLMPGPAGVDARSAAVAPPPPMAPPAAGPAFLPDDFDPFAASPPPAPGAGAARPAGAFDDLLASAPQTGSIDQMFGIGSHGAASAAADDPLARFLDAPPAAVGPSPAAAVPPGAASLDPLAMFGAPPPPAPVVPAQPDHVPAVHAAFVPPPVLRPSPRPVSAPPPAAVATPATAPATATNFARNDAGSTQLWQAFCQGAGIELGAQDALTPEKMQQLGEMVRNAVEGILQLVAVRASTKHELRAGVTVIQQRNNNPLKFSPDAKAALEQLLQPPLRGFLDGPQSMDDAMHDLVGHSIGTVAGMRAAVEGVLNRFEPQALEDKLVGGSVFDSLIPINRKAKLWDLYLQHHEAIREEAQEDFHTLFGKAFLAAYEQQVARLKRKKPTST